ncbi:DUF3108 domain-containing protein [Idiomarina seosinensis]|nr:DUF3108 domain-containing protein [Idiomarina seosinensis]
MKWLVAAVALLSFSTAAEQIELEPYEAEYQVTRGGSEYGEGYRKLEVSPEGEWQLRGKTDISWFILSDTRETRSVFTYNEDKQRFIPIEFLYMRSGTGSDKSFHASFDAQQKQVKNVDSGRLLEIGWNNGLYDEASVIEKLRLDVAAGSEDLTYSIIDEKGREDTYRFAIVGNEQLKTPYGSFKTVKVERVRDNNRRQTYFWLAPELNYLLVQMQQFKEGDEQAKMTLRSLTQ